MDLSSHLLLPSHSYLNCDIQFSSQSRKPSRNQWMSCCFSGTYANRPQAVMRSSASTGEQWLSFQLSASCMKMFLRVATTLLSPLYYSTVLRSGLRQNSICRMVFMQQVLPSLRIPLYPFILSGQRVIVIQMASRGWKYRSQYLSYIRNTLECEVAPTWSANKGKVLYLMASFSTQISLAHTQSSSDSQHSPNSIFTYRPWQGLLLMTISPLYSSRLLPRPSLLFSPKTKSATMRQFDPYIRLCYQLSLDYYFLARRLRMQMSEMSSCSLRWPGSSWEGVSQQVERRVFSFWSQCLGGSMNSDYYYWDM